MAGCIGTVLELLVEAEQLSTGHGGVFVASVYVGASHVCIGKEEACGAGQRRGDLLAWGRRCGFE